MEMCRLSFQGIPKVKVSNIEQVCFDEIVKQQQQEQNEKEEITKIPPSIRVGTADILDHLLSIEPNTDFSLVLGSDTFMDLTAWKWRRSKDVVNLVGGRILVIHRMVESVDNDEIRKILEERVDRLNQELCQQTDKDNESDIAENSVQIIEIPSLSSVSSSFVRTSVDESSLIKENGMLMPSVLEYIKKKNMYGFAPLVAANEEM
mmetsp:Transcript_39378/g.59192  ORF Transcript_39378/g.59192 Transcript_39378/m.59192 type:complete len:205 (+) Transcript_39378:436-1050(+)